MTLRWVEGFEVDGGPTYFLNKYANTPSLTALSGGRLFGNYVSGTTIVTFPLSASPIDEWVMGLGWFTGANPDPDTDFISFYLGGLPQLSVHLLSDRFLEVRRGTTVLETATILRLPDLDWAYIEFKALLHPSAGSYEVRVDGLTALSGTSVNTADSGLNDADTVVLRSNSNNRLDDWYILDTATGQRNDFLGPRAVEGIEVIGNGDVQDFTPSSGMDHAALVDDPPATLDANDFVESATNTDVDLFELGNLRFIKGGISGVAVNTVTGLSGVGTRTVRARYRNAADEDGSGTAYPLTSPASENRQSIFEQDPSGTPDTWAIEDINDGQFGIEVVS